MQVKLSLNTIKQLAWMLNRSKGDRDYCGSFDLNGSMFRSSIKDGQIILTATGETRDTWNGTIEHWNKLPGESDSGPLGADGLPVFPKKSA